MSQFILFVILGLGAGAAYAILGLGVVVIYKGSGILNFAQGAMAMFAAFFYVKMSNDGLPPGMAAVMTVVLAAVAGLVLYILMVRPLRNAPVLAKAVTTVGLMFALQGLAQLIFGEYHGRTPSLLPTNLVHAFGVSFGVDRLYVLGITIVIAVGLWALYKFTTFGIATRAAAESERGASLLGFSPDLIGAANWALGTALAALAGIFVAPITGLEINLLTLMVVPALAAALLGGFTSFGITVVVGVLIGVIQSELIQYWQQPGVKEAVPFVVIIIAMVVTGRTLPARGSLSIARPPFAPRTRLTPFLLAVVPVLAILGLATLSRTYQTGITTSLVTAVVALSLVLITGYLGQISFAQMTFAGVSAFAAAKLATDAGIPFPFPIILGGLIAVPIGLVIGLPALRVRGLNLAIITLGFAVAMSAAVFENNNWNGGSAGSTLPTPHLWGFSLGPFDHPTRYGIFVLIVLGLIALGVVNIRRSAFGQRMLAIRSNERSAAAAGVNVAATKLQAFALSAFIAGIGGTLAAYQVGAASPAAFSPFQSIAVLTVAYIGGIACVSGAMIAGAAVGGGILYTLLSGVSTINEYWVAISGVLLMITAITQPDGAAVANMKTWHLIREKLGSRPDAGPEEEAPPSGGNRERPAES